MRGHLDSAFGRRWASPVALAGIALFISFVQRPWQVWNDTRVELVTNPQLFLSKVPDVVVQTIDLGHIQASQFVGYLFPIGPWFAFWDLLGLPLWLVQRLWFALLIATAGWGMVRLVEATFGSRPRLTPFIAGLIYIVGPFVMVSFSRGSVWLIYYAALPWALCWARRGLAEPKGWRAPAVLALVLAATACATMTLVAWVVIAVSLLLAFEAATGPGIKAAWSLAWRTSLLSLGAAVWWLVPVLIQVKYGNDYLTFTEHAEAILTTPSASESLRQLGYWLSYLGGQYRENEAMPGIAPYLASSVTIVASFAIPLVAASSLVFLRRWRHGVFYALMLAFAVLVMSAGFPPDNFVSKAIYDLYYSAGPLQFLRTTYKAAPLAAVSLAVLFAAAVTTLWPAVKAWIAKVPPAGRRPWLISTAGAAALILLIGLWGRPLWIGGSVNRHSFFEEPPKAWVDAIRFAERTAPEGSRIAVLPGDAVSTYRWANTQMSIAPGLAKRPILIRQVSRTAPPDAAQLLEGTDNVVQQGRLVPGQLNPLLQLMGVGSVITGTDADPRVNPTIDAARAAENLRGQVGFGKPVATFGPWRTFGPPRDQVGPSHRLPQTRVYRAPVPARPLIKRILPVSAPVIVDGDAQGLIAMASVGLLDPERASFYSGSLDRRTFSAALAQGARLVYTDSNRRTALIPPTVQSNTSAVLAAGEPFNREFPVYDPFPALGSRGRTVAVHGGLASLYSPLSPTLAFDPSRRPFAAFDGNPATSWVAPSAAARDRYVEFTLAKPAAIGSIRILSALDSQVRTGRLRVSVNGGPLKRFTLRTGWNTIPLGSEVIRKVRLYATYPAGLKFLRISLGATPLPIREIEIPGVRVTEALRIPSDMTALASGRDLSRSPIDIVLERVTGDFPGHAGGSVEMLSARGAINQADAEQGMRRIVDLPVARSFIPSGWARVTADAPDGTIDRLAGGSDANRYTSSSRLSGLPALRASSAFDGDLKTAWAALFDKTLHPSIEWRGSTPVTIRELIITGVPGVFRMPARVSVEAGGQRFTDLPVRSGRVVLPRPVTADSIRVTVTRVAGSKRDGFISKLRVERAVGIAELVIPGLPRAAVRRHGSFSAGCGSVRVEAGGSGSPLSVSGRIEDLDLNRPLRANACGSSLPLPQGASTVATPAGAVFTLDHLRLASAAAAPTRVVPQQAAGSITPAGKVSLDGPGWLVLGVSYSKGWQAWCRDRAGRERSLGAPREIAGFANGWPIDGASCVQARFGFESQRLANAGYIFSAVFGLGLVVLLIVIRIRRGRTAEPDPGDDGENPNAVVAAFRGGLSAGRAARLSYAASAAMIAVTTVIYLFTPAGGGSPITSAFPIERVEAHWTAFVAVVLLLAGALVDAIRLVRERDPGDRSA